MTTYAHRTVVLINAPLKDSSSTSYAFRSVANRVSMPQTQGTSTPNERAISVHDLFVSVRGLIEVTWVNYRVNSGVEIVAGAAISDGAGQVTYTDRTTGNPITVQLTDAVTGSTTLTAADGGTMRGRATIDALAGTQIKFEEKDTISTGAIFTQFKSALVKGDRYEFSSGSVGAIGSAGVQTFETTYRGPSLITAMVPPTPIAAIWGDSISDGIYDVANTPRGDIGMLPRLLGELGVPFVNLSSRGDSASQIGTNSARRRELMLASGATYFINQRGINDFLGGNRTAAQVISDNTAFESYIGLPVVYTTILPFTTNGPTTPWSTGQEAQRQLYNQWVRNRPVYIDFDNILANLDGSWRNDDVPYADWLHVSAFGGSWAALNASIIGTSLEVHGMAPRSGAVVANKTGNLFASPYKIDNATWTKQECTVAISRKDAEYGATAQAMLETSATGNHRISHAGITMGTGSYELHMDLGYLGYQWLQLELAGIVSFAAVDVLNGATGNIYNANPSTHSIVTSSATPISNGYTRFKFDIVINAADTLVYPAIYTSLGNLSGVSHAGDTNKGFLARPKFFLKKIS